MKWDLSDRALQSDFVHAVEDMCGQNVSACYQCGKCSGGCPVLADVEPSPNRVIRMVQLGLEEDALHNELIWCCTACGICSSRCPMGIDLARVMDALRALAEQRGIEPPAEGFAVWTFYRAFLDSVRQFGRLNEVALMQGFNMNSGRVFANLRKAPWFLVKGKVALLPHRIKHIARLERVFQRVEKMEDR